MWRLVLEARPGITDPMTLRLRNEEALKIAALLNQYEAGRANIVVYNWDRKNQVELDVSGALRNGERFEVRNAQDFYGPPVSSGVYDGAPLRLPMAGSQPAQEFGAFVLMKRNDRDN